jgi:hypothetical protein
MYSTMLHKVHMSAYGYTSSTPALRSYLVGCIHAQRIVLHGVRILFSSGDLPPSGV